MPELPEVETLVFDLQTSKVINQTIKKVEIFYPKIIATPFFAKRVTHQKITSIKRRGKYILIHLSNDETIVVHLKMTGHFLYSKEHKREKHIHLCLILGNGENLFFHDTRKFGRIYLVKDVFDFLKKLGPEPLENIFSEKDLYQMLAKRKCKIKTLLMDQSFVAGIGNIYSDEILWKAKINPKKHANFLTQDEAKSLFLAIKSALLKGIKNRGTTLGKDASHFSSLYGEMGHNQNSLNAYGRKNLPCRRCKTLIQRIVLNQRGTCFCPKCQR
jgi:formamidopyrimidine-DNA glycosylase